MPGTRGSKKFSFLNIVPGRVRRVCDGVHVEYEREKNISRYFESITWKKEFLFPPGKKVHQGEWGEKSELQCWQARDMFFFWGGCLSINLNITVVHIYVTDMCSKYISSNCTVSLGDRQYHINCSRSLISLHLILSMFAGTKTFSRDISVPLWLPDYKEIEISPITSCWVEENTRVHMLAHGWTSSSGKKVYSPDNLSEFIGGEAVTLTAMGQRWAGPPSD